MMTSEEMAGSLQQFAMSGASRDDVLKFAVGMLKEERAHYDWVGIYLLEGDTLVLHNYEGKPTEHTHIPVGVGVCGTAVAERANQIVGDVTALDNYLACSLETRAEIVVLIRKGDQIFGQIDIDSDIPNVFNDADEALLNRIADLLADALAGC
jgi:GAF domain-containing protein